MVPYKKLNGEVIVQKYILTNIINNKVVKISSKCSFMKFPQIKCSDIL